MKLISFLVPVYNEEDNVAPLAAKIADVMSPLSTRYDYELIFTDNRSNDRTWERIAELALKNPRMRAFRFSRNFGYQRSILTGYAKARGACAIQLDCDFQDPPELVLQFLRHWEEGAKVVYGVRRSRQESWWMNTARSLFYRLIDSLSEDDLPHDAGDFRLVDRRAIDELLKIEDSSPYLRGTLATLGFTQVGVPYDRGARERGVSKFAVSELVGLALDGILNHSIVPLRLATYTGLAISVLTFLAMVGYAAGKLFFNVPMPAGWATTTAFILLSLSVNSIFFGVIGEYLGRMYRQIKRRPLVIVDEAIER
ncbi:MAG: glycosyltransferase family 2 protein [Elusimicrobiota bacterium]